MSSDPIVPQAAQKFPKALACAQCRRRKIKCDHKTPCSNCLKIDVACVPYKSPSTRKRRLSKKSLEERLARCEALVIERKNQPSPSDEASVAQLSMSPNLSGEDAAGLSPLTTSKPIDVGSVDQPIHQQGGHFPSSHLQTSIYTKVNVPRNHRWNTIRAMHIDHGGLSPQDDVKPFFIGETIESQYPKPVHIFVLWQVYLDRVNPLTKIIHVPTLQPYVTKATTNPADVPLSYQALLFGIYLMAVISLSDEECQQMLENARHLLLKNFTTQTRNALAQFGFAMNHDMASLQACILFQLSLNEQCGREEAKVLSEVILSVATNMNYHRDGQLLNLSPFETEMRRRIWWHIVSQDTCLNMNSGLSVGFSRRLFDTKPPRNLNDVDLFPLSSKPIASVDGPTEMAFVLIRSRLAEFVISQNKENTGFGRGVLTQRNETITALGAGRYRESLAKLEQDVREIERKYVNPSAGGVHSAALAIRTMITNNFLDVPYLGRKQSTGSTGSFGDQDDVSEAVVKDNEDRTDAYMRLAQHGFAWFARHTFRVDIFADLIGQLRQWPVGHLSDRGWVVADKTYRWLPELFDMERYVIQAHFTLEAFEAREQALARYGCAAETPWFITRLRKAFSTH
ncbi:hypothetical protein NM208_g3751 [Fusarium decemcellulare]|uniref:Uncharacterized protein n=1 Tax=Fusarium decemcellulare TaxID=57161 RepID=A0ACC1SNB2_9HYPO|nr:hypothetical protein NM208_g3751 [Fusarium decemcellulare]